MKKTLSLLLAVIMLLSACAFGNMLTATAAAQGLGLGDVNADGVINARDSLLMKKFVVGMTAPMVEASADLDGDGKITTKDCRYLTMYISGAVEDFNGINAGNPLGSLKIAGNDISTYDCVYLVYPEDSLIVDCYKHGIKQMRDGIEDATGYYMNIVSDPDDATAAHHIYFSWLPKTEYLGEQGYRWVVDDKGDMYIYGGSHTGILNAACEFLHKYVGYRYFAVGGECFIPRAYSNVPEGLDETVVPQFRHRDVHHDLWIDGDRVQYLCEQNHINGHDDRGYLEQAKFGYGYGNSYVHAHSFGYIFDNLGDQEQPCLSQPANLEIAKAWARNLVHTRMTQSHPEYLGYNLRRISISWNDNTNYCECSSCRATYRNEQSVAGALVPFANSVADYLQTADNGMYAGVHVYYIAYNTARIPPKYARPNEWCDIEYCWSGCNNHTFDSNDCSDTGDTKGFTNWRERYYFEFWSKITDNLSCWYYATSFAWNIGACPNTLNIREDLRYLASHGAVGIYMEFEGSAIYTFEPLKCYLASRCMWNPYMSEAEEQQIIDEFLEYKYGAGWRYIKEYLYMNDEGGNRMGCFTNNYDWPGDMHNTRYYIDNYEKMVQLFDNAKALVLNEDQYDSLQVLSVQMHWMALTGAILKYGDKAIVNNEDYSDRYEEMYDIMKTYQYDSGVYGVLTRDGKNMRQTPMESWLNLTPDGIWETWYRSVGRQLPRDQAGDSENRYLYLEGGQPTRTNNPLSTWIP